MKVHQVSVSKHALYKDHILATYSQSLFFFFFLKILKKAAEIMITADSICNDLEIKHTSKWVRALFLNSGTISLLIIKLLWEITNWMINTIVVFLDKNSTNTYAT